MLQDNGKPGTNFTTGSKLRKAFCLRKLSGVNNCGELNTADAAIFAVGGSGIVVQCVNANAPAVRYALKVVRPSLFGGNIHLAELENKKLLTEFANHAPLAHPNIAKVLQAGEVSLPGALRLNAVLMEWIPGATPLLRYCLERVTDYSAFLRITRECFSALAHLHDRGLIHWDIKSANLLIDDHGNVKLTDIGNARPIKEKGNPRDNLAFSTEGQYPPELRKYRETEMEMDGEQRQADRAVSANRVPIRLPSLEWDISWLDMWMLARELNRLLNAEETLFNADAREVPLDTGEWERRVAEWQGKVFPATQADAQYALNYLQLITRRLLRSGTPSGLRFYETADEVVIDLEKLEPEFGAAQGVEELRAVPQNIIRIPHTGNAPWTRRMHAIFNSPALVRLKLHSQLGAVSEVYPGGSHRRFEHAIGVASGILDYVRALYADRTSPFWRVSIEAFDIDALLFAGIVHDIGHIAYGHYLEQMRGVFAGRKHEDYVVQVLNPDHSSADGHRRRFGQVADKRILEDRAVLLEVVKNYWLRSDSMTPEAFLAHVAEILRPSSKESYVTEEGAIYDRAKSARLKIDILHSILDGPIDADKSDYLLRDAWHAGIQYPQGIDKDRFFQAITTIFYVPKQNVGLIAREHIARSTGAPTLRACVGVLRKGVLPLESMLFGRYQMFTSVYWQHTSRAETALLQFAVQEYLRGFPNKQVETELEKLVAEFAKRNDTDAIIWLSGEIDNHVKDPVKALALDACSALLGNRDNLYWSGYEITYEKRESTNRETLYKRLTRLADAEGGASNLHAYLKEQASLRQKLASQLSTKLRRKGKLLSGDVLVDIPEADKDQINNVFVLDGKYGESLIKPIQDVSPIAQAVSETFRYWARRIRVFLSPRAWALIEESGLSSVEISSAISETLDALTTGDSGLVPNQTVPALQPVRGTGTQGEDTDGPK